MLSEEIKGAGHAQPDKSKAEMQLLSIDKPVGLKEVGRRFVINSNMNEYHLAINELWEKPDKESCSVNSPTAAPQDHGDEDGRKQQPQRLLKMELDQSTNGIINCESDPVLRGPLLIPFFFFKYGSMNF